MDIKTIIYSIQGYYVWVVYLYKSWRGDHNQRTTPSIEWLTYQMIKLAFHICVQKRLITLTTAPENIIFSPQIVCHLQYILNREMNNSTKNIIELHATTSIVHMHTNIPQWLSSLEQQHMHTHLIQSCKAVHFVSHEPNWHKDPRDRPCDNCLYVT